jgi:hypothetical protein
MDIDSSEKNSKFLTRKELYYIRKEKLKREIESAKRVLERGIEPLKIADQFIHNTFKLIEDEIIRRNPGLDLNWFKYV